MDMNFSGLYNMINEKIDEIEKEKAKPIKTVIIETEYENSFTDMLNSFLNNQKYDIKDVKFSTSTIGLHRAYSALIIYKERG